MAVAPLLLPPLCIRVYRLQCRDFLDDDGLLVPKLLIVCAMCDHCKCEKGHALLAVAWEQVDMAACTEQVHIVHVAGIQRQHM